MANISPSPVLQYLDESGALIFALDNQGIQQNSATDGIVAHAGGGQANGTLLVSSINRVITVATAADSVLLPPSKAGASLTIINAAAANSMNLFPAVGDKINALAINTAFAIAAGKTVEIYCCTAGQWHTVLSA